MTAIRLEALSKSYGAQFALNRLDLRIHDGEFTVLVGPSGCGKTTTLRLIAGLEKASHGEIYFDDRPVGHLPPRDRDVAVVFQHYSLYGHLTVEENVVFGLKARKTPPAVIQERLDEIVRLLKIRHLLKRRPAQLSGGEQQRVAIGRALARNPKLFLFDEPLSNLDAALRAELRTEIVRLHQLLRTTAIFVTHDQAEAMSMADNLVVMRNGEILQSGSPLDVYRHPANMFVAKFIGSPAMNLIPGEIVYENGCYRFMGNGVGFDIRKSGHIRAIEQIRLSARNFFMGIRPEHITLDGGDGFRGSNNGMVRLNGTLRAAEHLGAETVITVQCAQTPVKARLWRNQSVPEDEPLALYFKPEHIHLFNAQTTFSITSQPMKGE